VKNKYLGRMPKIEKKNNKISILKINDIKK